MRAVRTTTSLLVALLLLGAAIPAFATAQDGPPEQPAAIVGTFDSASGFVTPAIFPEVAVALVDARNFVTGASDEWIPVTGQILGSMTTPTFPLPSRYRINLPISPTGSSLDLDNDGETDAGVQVYYLIVASDIIGDSYLSKLEQLGGLTSFLTDALTNRITQGDLVVYAPDDAQAFPASAGADGVWFTADDPAEPLARGYTVVRLAADGTSTRDRSPEATIDTREPVEEASPDFSQQGILESFNALIDLLRVRYAYTELRGLDWEAIRAQYLPDVERADAANDLDTYYLILTRLALSIQDGHVNVLPWPGQTLGIDEVLLDGYLSGIGAHAIDVQDGSTSGTSIQVLTVGADTPAAAAGWVTGTEIVSVDGLTPDQRLAQIPLRHAAGTATAMRRQKMDFFLNFPAGHEATIAYKLPGSDEVQTAKLVAGDYPDGRTGPGIVLPPPFPINLTYLPEGYTLLEWTDFASAADTKIAVLEEALALHQGYGAGGMIIDLRGNGGGWGELYQVMASYFFTADDPLPVGFYDFWDYDQAKGTFVRPEPLNYTISAPSPELAYGGPLVILINDGCASACEYFAQTLQKTGRAIVVGQYPSDGAGGAVDFIQMPGGGYFTYTKGRTTFAGTDEFNLEAKGVIPDVRVPVTVETELAKQAGEDPVLRAGIAELDRLNAEQSATPVGEASPGPDASPVP